VSRSFANPFFSRRETDRVEERVCPFFIGRHLSGQEQRVAASLLADGVASPGR
jgi:hypothetical protein